MNFLAVAVLLALASAGAVAHAQESHDHMKGMEPSAKSSRPVLQPPQGARVQIVSPKPGQVFKGDKVPLQFKLTKGKRGEHVHAYVDGEMMGMFSSEKGTLNGIKPGQHTL